MPGSLSAHDRIGLGFIAAALATGVGVHALRTQGETGAWEEDLAADTAIVALERRVADEVGEEERRASPLREGERLDANTATASELDRLPRVGPALAARIVEWRTSHGRFRSLADLDSVPGIGPATLAGLAPHLNLPEAPPPRQIAVAAAPLRGSSPGPVDVNRASAAELEALPGIGPTLAQRIVADREANGRFATLGELERVSGIGPKLVERLSGRARAGS